MAISIFPFTMLGETPWFLVARPRDLWADRFEPLRGDVAPRESLPRAATRIAEEHGLRGIERVFDVGGGRAFAVRMDEPQAVMLDRAAFEEARWVPFHAAAALLGEGDKRSLRVLNRVLDVMLRRVDVVFEETIDTTPTCEPGG